MSERIRFRLDIAYDGTAFAGWAKQPGHRTVQGVLEEAMALLSTGAGRSPVITVAGRTDAGVHAVGQVAHVDLDEKVVSGFTARGREAGAVLLRRLNGILGPLSDVVITDAKIAPDGFDARFSATWRRYEYRIADNLSFHDPLQRHRTRLLRSTFDVDQLNSAAQSLVGLRDFAAFCKPRPGASTIRELQEFSWIRDANGVLVATLQADAFCHSMVRSLVGGCVGVGEGRLSLDGLAELLRADERGGRFAVQPAHGLTLLAVGYPGDALLAARARETRAMRSVAQVHGAGDDTVGASDGLAEESSAR